MVKVAYLLQLYFNMAWVVDKGRSLGCIQSRDYPFKFEKREIKVGFIQALDLKYGYAFGDEIWWTAKAH